MRAALALLLLAAACSEGPRAFAGKVESRADLIGGPRAIGDVGDFKIANGRVRFIVQGKDAPRVYGTFGGSLIDADLVRSNELDPQGKPVGRDGLGELFPAFFLSAVEPTKISVIDDGSTGGVARIRVIGKPGEFLTSTKLIDAATIGTGVSFAVDYALGPNDDFLTITSTVLNESTVPHSFPVAQLPIPLGVIALFGDGQPLFLPGEAGYDVRFTLEKTYKRTYALPAFPGLTTDVVAVQGDGISYGLTFCPDCENPFGGKPAQPFVFHHRSEYEPYAQVARESMLVPFISGTLFGLFAGEAPPSLPGADSVSTTVRLRVSDGSAAHVIDAARKDSGAELVKVTGVVREERSEEPVAHADVVLLRDAPGAAAETTATSDDEGRFTALVRPGAYVALARKAPHPNAQPVKFTAPAYIEPHLGRTALLAVEISDETGRRVPAKVTLEGRKAAPAPGVPPRDYLYDLRIGDPYRPTDLESDRFIEATFRAGADGRVDAEVRPGTYRLYVSRGPAYDVDAQDVELVAGQLKRIGARVRRVLPRDGRIAADLHVHANNSVDSDVTAEQRALSYAAEGIDFLAMTEHNYLRDLQPVIDGLGLTDFVRGTVGVEVSSLEAGHWNAYPLQFDPGDVTHGSVQWFRKAPGQLFADLRARGKYGPAETIVEVNHPRDAIQGYFTAYGLTGDALSGNLAADAPGKSGSFAPSGPGFGPGTFSLDFDAVEILTGKRFDLLRTFKVPDPNPEPCTGPSPRPVCHLAPGTVVRDATGAVAFPGALEDWEHLLDAGHRVTAVGNSDSHKLLDGEGGYPRNLIDVGHPVASAREIDEREVVRAIKAGRVTVTTAPQISLSVKTASGEVPAGTLVTPDADGTVTVHLVVDAAPWVDVTRAELIIPAPPGCFRGDACSRVRVPVEPAPPGETHRIDQLVRVRVPDGKDAWIAAEVRGDRSLWPIVIPYEIPTLLLTDAVGTVGAAVGLSDEFGALKPTQQTQTYPYALANPVLIDGNGDGKWSGVALPAARKAPGGPADLRRELDAWAAP